MSDRKPEFSRLDEKNLDWQQIKTAPRDGSHFTACEIGGFRDFGFGDHVRWLTTVHYWDNEGEEGFYTSVNENAPMSPVQPTHWRPLPNPPSSDPVTDDEDEQFEELRSL